MAMNNILGLFAHSPLKPLQKHSTKVTECCDRLIPFFEATFAKDWDNAETLRVQIAEDEREADALKREIRLKLPRGLFMPIDRRDLLELITQQDKFANYAKRITTRVMTRHLYIPEDLQQPFLEYLQCSLESTRQAHRVIDEIDELLETGFKGRELKLVNKLINELDKLEDDTEVLQLALRRKLFSMESQFSPVDILFFHKIIDWVSELAEQAQRVGSRIELMLARS
ncbi:TIGR00153 family protein [Conservatibacter flavescens]|uniref:TIGR00153 family protein n=1 Tax=Conservatibacter flavescens TaxID=28161 RepID=A0A2M8S0V2_9PAST|nr:TIGR00153 family protein [Conservatibacter flavescens]PJG84748.1 TIGR00153 family protein [Conservatibacter flavescens]